MRGTSMASGFVPEGQHDRLVEINVSPWLKGLGASNAHTIRSKDSEPMLAMPGSPFRANSGGGISQGKPWAILCWPLRAKASSL